MGGAGCAINQEPFNKFSTATESMQTGTEKCMDLAYDFAKSDFSENFVVDPESEFPCLKLSSPTKDKTKLSYGLKPAQQPLFTKIIQTRTALQKLNSAFSTYASLLQLLAGTKPLSAEELKALATSANNAADTALALADQKVPEGTGVLIGKAFSMCADLYVKDRIKSNLKKAIEGNHTQVKRYADQGKEMVSFLRETLREAYQSKFLRIQREWEKTKPPKGEMKPGDKAKFEDKANLEKRTQLLASALALNLKYAASFEVLAALDKVYEFLPEANRDLAESVRDSDAKLPQLNKLSNLSADLKILNTNLSSLMKQE
jgi:hypothetical protein